MQGLAQVKQMPLEKTHASIANSILNSCYELSVVERRIILLALGRMNTKLTYTSSDWYEVSVDDYARLMQVAPRKAYETLTTSLDNFFNRYIVIKGLNGPKSKLKFRWVQAIEHIPNTHTIRLKWSDDFLPFITALEKDVSFSRLFLPEALKIDGIYANRLYDLVFQEKWKYTNGSGLLQVNVQELITQWCVPDYMQDYRFFKRDVLVPAMKELLWKDIVWIKSCGVQKRNITDIYLQFIFDKSTFCTEGKEKKKSSLNNSMFVLSELERVDMQRELLRQFRRK